MEEGDAVFVATVAAGGSSYRGPGAAWTSKVSGGRGARGQIGQVNYENELRQNSPPATLTPNLGPVASL
jgi:hypothetical protein